MKNPVYLLRITALVEGVSFLILLGIAMPLKYVWGMPEAVKIVGWAHGILFVIFGLLLLQVMIVADWQLKRSILVFVAALVPFGPFLIDRRMIRYEEEYLQAR